MAITTIDMLVQRLNSPHLKDEILADQMYALVEAFEFLENNISQPLPDSISLRAGIPTAAQKKYRIKNSPNKVRIISNNSNITSYTNVKNELKLLELKEQIRGSLIKLGVFNLNRDEIFNKIRSNRGDKITVYNKTGVKEKAVEMAMKYLKSI